MFYQLNYGPTLEESGGLEPQPVTIAPASNRAWLRSQFALRRNVVPEVRFELTTFRF